MNPASVHFLIAGVQKGGTSALHGCLRTHPDLFLPAKKELHFFDDDQNFSSGTPDYGPLFEHFAGMPPGKVSGEATPAYLWWPGAMARIYRFNPSVRLILVLRNPVLRAYSHWNMQRARGIEPLEFADAIRAEPARARDSAPEPLRQFSYIDRGYYAEQIRNVLRFFPPDQVLPLKSETVRDDPDSALGRITGFLGVAPFEQSNIPVAHRGSYAGNISEEDFLQALAMLEFDIRSLEKLLGWDLSAWRNFPGH